MVTDVKTYPHVPMTYEEMAAMLPDEFREGTVPKWRSYVINRILPKVDLNLFYARQSSYMPIKQSDYTAKYDFGPLPVERIQRQMSAIRFRLDIHDYSGTLEKIALTAKLYELYKEAREIDPEGTARFERMIDKRMKKGERRNGNYRR